jgi:membrane fusion protein (multidrug efflux system)
LWVDLPNQIGSLRERAARRARACSRAALALLAGAALAAGCGGGGEGRAGGEPPPSVVELHRVQPETLRDVAVFGGQLEAEHSVLVKSETDGVVAEVLFEEGQQVRAGRALFRLKRDAEAARLREAEAQRGLAREVFERTRQLLERDATSIARHDEAAAQLAVAESRVELARVALDRTEVRAPFDGVVGRRLVSPGDRVTDADPLVQIDAIDRLEAVFTMTDAGIVVAEPGLPVEVRVAPYPNERFRGEVFFVSPTVDPETRRLTLKAWVPNPEGRLRAGLYADVELQVARRENALLVPEPALVSDRSGTYVWRVDAEQRAERVPVETGLRKDGRVEVTLGLRPGDVVVAAGTHKVFEGVRVSDAARPPTGQASRALEAPGAGT